MVSKNNVQVKDRYTTQQVPHYGIRKLSVGVASVLLGTTFYMGINGNVAHADTVNGQEHETPDSQVANNNSNGNSDSAADHSANAVLGDKQVAGSATGAAAAVTNEVNAKPQVTEITNGSHLQSDATNAVKSDASALANAAVNTNTPVNTATNMTVNTNANTPANTAANTNVNTQSQNEQNHVNATQTTRVMRVTSRASNVSPNVLSASLAESTEDSVMQQAVQQSSTLRDDRSTDYAGYIKGQAQSVTLKDGSSLSVNSDVINSDTDQSAILTFKSSSFKSGDTYTILIPHIMMMRNESNVAHLQPSFGTTTVDELRLNDGKYYWKIVDRFVNSGTVSQDIKLSRITGLNIANLENYFSSADFWRPYDLIHGTINLIKGTDRGSLDFKYQLGGFRKNLYPKYDLANGNLKYPLLNGQAYDFNVGLSTVSLIKNDSSDGFGLGKDVLKNVSLSIENDHDYLKLNNPVANIYNDLHQLIGTMRVQADHGKLVFSDLKLNDTVPVIGSLVNSPEIYGNVFNITFNATVNVPKQLFNGNTFTFSSAVDDFSFTFNNPKVGSLQPGNPRADIKVLPDLNDVSTGNLIAYVHSHHYMDLGASDYRDHRARITKATIDHDDDIPGVRRYSGFYPEPMHLAVNGLTLSNLNYHLDIPDGFDLYSVDFNSIDHITSAIIRLKDGTSYEFSPDDLRSYYDHTNQMTMVTLNHSIYGNLSVDSDSSIASIDIKYHDVDSSVDIGPDYVSSYNQAQSYRIAPEYVSGKPVQVGDLLTFTAAISSTDPHVKIDSAPMVLDDVLITDPNRDTLRVYHEISSMQSNKTPGVIDAGSLSYRDANHSNYGYPHLTHAVTYLQIPDNASLTDIKEITVKSGLNSDYGNLTPKSISLVKVANGVTFIKVDLSNYNDIRAGFSISVPYSNVGDLQTSSRPASMLVVSDNFDQDVKGVQHFASDTDSRTDTALKTLIEQENIDVNKTDYQGSTDSRSGWWDILTSDGMTSATMTKGNVNSGPSMDGNQNDHTAQADRFDLYGSTINATDQSIPGAVQIINVPSTSDGHSQFNPQLTGPIHVIDANTGKNLDDIAHVTYSELPATLRSDSLTNAANEIRLTASQVTDWSKIKSIAIRMDVPKRTSARAVLSMKDPQVYDHVGKTIYVANAIFSTQANDPTGEYHLKPIVINAGDPASAKLTVAGQSTVKTMVHYHDAQGDHYVELPDKARTYNELHDVMNRSDFPQSDSDLTAADRALLPAGMVLDYAHPKIKNSNETYLNSYQNGTAVFGQQVKYNFDQDQVIFEGAMPTQVSGVKTVTETIHYVYANGPKAGQKADNDVTKSVEFSRSGFKNPFTGDVQWMKSTNSKTFDAVKSPDIKGYHADQSEISTQTVTQDSNNIEKTVKYFSQSQKMTINYIDDDAAGKVLHSDAKTGLSGETADYTTANEISLLKGQHYVLVSDDTKGQKPVYDDDVNRDQVFNVHVKHATHSISDSRTVTETVHYQAADGSQVPSDHLATANFNRTGTHDEVTGADHWNAWNVSSHNFDAVPTPAKTGYTPDVHTVPAETATPGSSNIRKVVTYTPDAQKLSVKFIDDTTGQVLKTVAKTGVTNANAGYNTQSDIHSYEGQHYVLVSDSSHGTNLVFDNNDSVDQAYEVHLKHGTHPINEHHTITQTVHYSATDHASVPDDHTVSVQFDRDGYHDEVTGTDHWNAWKQGGTQTFTEVPTPKKAGYTPDKPSVPATVVHPSDHNQTITVTYTPDTQKVIVTFIDDTDSGKTLKTVTKTGPTNSRVGYTTGDDINTYKGQHYVLVSDQTHGQNITFDTNTNTDQRYEVHLKHGTHQINDRRTVTETVHYKITDGTTAPADRAAKREFSRDGFNDEVTGVDHWNAWTPGATQQFDAVHSPAVKGYTPDADQITAVTVNPDSKNIDRTVTYSPDAQKLDVTFIDDTAGTTLKTVVKNGVTHANAGYNTQADIHSYENQHYVLVSDSSKGAALVFDNDDAVDQHYVVHLKHNAHAISEHHTVNETVHYTVADGSEVPADHTANVQFDRDGFNDEVTGTDHWNAWRQGNTQTFAEVPTPAKKGYTPDIQLVDTITVNPTDQNIKRTVTYTPDAQKLNATFIDDTTGETLKTVVKNGVTHADAKYNTQADIQNFERQHYVLVSDSSKGAALVFDNDDAVDQHYEVHLKHATHAISEHHTVNETVNYQMSDGTKAPADYQAKALSFSRDGFNDEVTGIDHWNAWTPNATQQFDTVHSPLVAGYTPDIVQIDAQTVKPTDHDLAFTVTYTPNVQIAHVKYIDDTDHKVLTQDDLNGRTGETSGYHTADRITEFKQQHYVFVSDNYPTDGMTFDNHDRIDQTYEVHFKHATRTDEQDVQVPRTIKYVYQNGQPAQPDHADALSFHETKVVDLVDGHTVSDDWTPAQDFKTIETPAIQGYTPDHVSVSNTGITHDHAAITETVTYNPDAQKAVVKYIDDTTGKQLEAKDLTGVSDQSTGYTTKSTIDGYVNKHYVLASDDTDGKTVVFDHNDDADQAYEVHLKHGTEPANESRIKKITVHYQYADGLARSGKAADDKTATNLTFKRTGTHDLVTDKIAWNAWDHADQTFAAIDSPAIQGYTPDRTVVDSIKVNPDSHDLTDVTVTYNADSQKLSVDFIDDTTGKTLKTVTKIGYSDESADYNTKADIQDLISKHYDLTNDQTNGENLVFDHDDNINQHYEVHLSHHTHQINEQHTVTETVHYQYADGLARSGKAADDFIAASLNFSRDGFNDEVTGVDHWNAWTPADHQRFAAVQSPVIEGYTPDQSEISMINVVPTSQSIEKTVTYTADAQKLSVDFIDDTTGQTLKTVNKTGYSDESVGYNTKADIQTFAGQHYDLVSDATKGADLVFDHDDSSDQHYEVHLSHHTHQINEHHTVTETVHYQYADGLARSGKAADDFNANALKFSRDGFNDEVTGVDHWNAWTPADQQSFAAVQSPVIEGYTPDQSEIGVLNVVPTSQSIEKTVTYTADAQKLTVNFIDDVTGQTLKTVTKTGYSDESVGYNTKADIQNFVGQHYDLVSDATKGADLVFDHNDAVDQAYDVHLTHHLTPISDHQVVNETIHYVYADGLARTGKATDDYVATPLEFNRTGKHDDVTGTDAWDAWIPGSASFAAVQSPAIQGYTPDQSQVAAVSVDANSQDIVKTVTYSADQQTVTVDFIDDTDGGKVLKTVTKTGGSDEAVGYNTKTDIQTFVDGHYKLDRDTTNGNDLVFDHDDATDQHYEVHLTHETAPISEATSTNQVIHYQLADGTPVANDYTAKADFSRDGFKDLVTNADHWNAWTPNATQTFAAVKSPAKAGYTPDHAQVDAVTVEPHHADLETTVTYSPDAQKVTVKYIDDTTGETLQTKELTGVSDETSTYTTKSTIKQYVGQYYKLVSDQTNGKPVVFDHNDGNDQTFEVHLTHTYQEVSQEHQVHQTIHYRYADSKQARPDYTAKAITFNRTGTQDLVTENIQWNAWTPDQVFAAVDTPAVNGYTPDVQTVAPTKVSHDSKNIEQTVIYHADDQTILVNYIDDETHSTLKTDSIIGKTAQTSDYTTKKSLDKYKSQHYDVVSDDTNGDTLKFDSDSTKVQTYNVHLKHQHQAASDKSTVRQTVHYVYQDGKQAAKDHAAAPIEFTRTGDTDLVTGKTIWNAWTPATGTFTVVVSPLIEGYTPSRVMIEHVNVHPGDKDLDTTVTYVPDRQVIVVNYIDQTTGKTLKTDTLNGHSDQTSGYTTKSQINSYVGQHYKLISDDTHGRTLTFDHNDQATQTYDVVLGHQTEAAHRTHEVRETIDYVYADGSQAAKSFTAQPLVFNQTGVHDLVTNTTDWNGEWTKPQAFAAVESPKIIGFTASKPEVKAVNVDRKSGDVHELVIYAANAQTAQIKYIDDVTGKTLETDGANGHFGESIVFDHNVNDQINKFKQAHYKLVSNNFAGQKYQADNTKNVYEVHLTHERQNVHATDTVTETVKFQYTDGSQAQPTQTQTVNFGRDGIKDLVTGTTAWMPVDPQVIGAVNVPVLDGYTADTDQIPAVKVHFGDDDMTKVVTYTANDQTAGIKIIDDTTGKVLNTQSATGKFGTEIQFKQNPDQQVIDLQAQHYELVSDNFKHQAYQSDNAQNQFEIHVRHQTADAQRTDDVTETVHYRDNHGNQLRPDTQVTKTFVQAGVLDKVTGKVAWNPIARQTIDQVTAPEITGYTPDRSSVPAVTVNFGDNDIDQTIVYTPVQETAAIKYVDDTTGKTLLTDHTTGDFGTQINFDHDPITQIGQYESQGYKLVSNSYGNQAHQFSATTSDNYFEVHLIHGTKDAVRTSTVNRVINYVDSVTVTGEKLRPSTTQTLTFTEHGVTDEVTGKTTWTDVPVQHFAKIATPDIQGYTTEMKTVDSAAVQFGDADLEVNVPYTKVAVPEQPGTPGTPERPETPSQPGTPQIPEQPGVSADRQASHAQPAANNNAAELPQTGDDSQHGAALAGLGLIGMIGAFFGFKKKREPKN